MPSSRSLPFPVRPLLLLTLLSAPPTLAAQEASPASPPSATASAPDRAALQRDLEDVRAELLAILDEAARQPALQDRWTRLSDLLRETMARLDPGVQEDLDRIGELDVEAERALKKGDAERFRVLMREAEAIEERLGRVQLEAMGSREVARANARYQLELQDAMRDLDARTPELVRRMHAMEARLGVESVGVLRYLLP